MWFLFIGKIDRYVCGFAGMLCLTILSLSRVKVNIYKDNPSQESRNRVGRLHRVEYDAAARLSAEDREIALQLAQKSVDLFMQRFLALLQCNGLSTDLKAGEEHAIAYELLLTFIRADDLGPIETHAVNKDGEKVFSEYFGRWLNRYGKE